MHVKYTATKVANKLFYVSFAFGIQDDEHCVRLIIFTRLRVLNVKTIIYKNIQSDTYRI